MNTTSVRGANSGVQTGESVSVPTDGGVESSAPRSLAKFNSVHYHSSIAPSKVTESSTTYSSRRAGASHPKWYIQQAYTCSSVAPRGHPAIVQVPYLNQTLLNTVFWYTSSIIEENGRRNLKCNFSWAQRAFPCSRGLPTGILQMIRQSAGPITLQRQAGHPLGTDKSSRRCRHPRRNRDRCCHHHHHQPWPRSCTLRCRNQCTFPSMKSEPGVWQRYPGNQRSTDKL